MPRTPTQPWYQFTHAIIKSILSKPRRYKPNQKLILYCHLIMSQAPTKPCIQAIHDIMMKKLSSNHKNQPRHQTIKELKVDIISSSKETK